MNKQAAACKHNYVKAGFVLRSGGRKQRYQCKHCGHVSTEMLNREKSVTD